MTCLGWCTMAHQSFTTSCQLVTPTRSLLIMSIHCSRVLPGLLFSCGLHHRSCFWGRWSGIHCTWPLHDQVSALYRRADIVRKTLILVALPRLKHLKTFLLQIWYTLLAFSSLTATSFSIPWHSDQPHCLGKKMTPLPPVLAPQCGG